MTLISFARFPSLFLGRNLDNSGDEMNYTESFLKGHDAEALVSGAVNFQVMGGGFGGVVVPKQFSAKVAGVDLFEQQITNALAGYPPVIFSDCWLYHQRIGEIHCGSSARRQNPVGQVWWKNQPQ